LSAAQAFDAGSRITARCSVDVTGGGAGRRGLFRVERRNRQAAQPAQWVDRLADRTNAGHRNSKPPSRELIGLGRAG